MHLYASVDNEFWVYRHGAGLKAADAPGSYYQMDRATVPLFMRGLADGLFPGANVQWGVTLPEATVDSIQNAMRGHSGGTLLIDGSAEVRLETPPGNSKTLDY